MNHGARILSFERFSRRWTFAMAGLTAALRVAPAFAAGMTAFAAADHWLHLPVALRVALWLAAVGATAAAAATAFRPLDIFSARSRARTLAQCARGHGVDLREDDLHLAAQLAERPGAGSEQLRELYLEQIAGRLERCQPRWSFPRRPWQRPILGALSVWAVAGGLWAAVPALSPFDARVLNPFFSVDLDRYVRVTPGDARVPLGSDVDIRLEVLEGDKRPDLMVHSGSGWSLRAPDTEGRARLYHVRNVVEPLAYRVRWEGAWSRRYTLTPVEPVRFSAFSIQVRPPAYTGKPAATQTSPEISALAGSAVALSVRASQPIASAELAFSDGRVKPVTIEAGHTLRVSFTVEKTGTYGFSVAGQPTERYPINVVEDRPPEITLLSPTDALVVGEREKIPLTFDVRDDIQVAEVRLEWELKGRTRTQMARKFDERSTGGIFTYAWDIRGSGLRPGDVARYRLVASDANTVTGPGTAATPWMEISVESFEREHDALAQALGAWRDRTVDLLAQMNTLKAQVDKPQSNLDTAAASFNSSEQLSNRLEEALRAIVSRMQNDPLADYGVTMEHEAMLHSLEAINKSLMPQARAALSTKNRAAASSQLDNIASELERMTALSEDLTKRQNARDVVEGGDRLQKLGEELRDTLANSQPNDPDLASKLNEVMEEARKNLAQIAHALKQMPQELPEDFVNQQGLKNVPLGKAQDLLSSIADAVKRGDMKTAVQLAQQFLEMTRQMGKTLSDAEDSYTKASSPSELESQIAEQAGRVDKIANDQRSILAETQKLETARLQRRLKAQDDAFQKLAVRQRALVGKARDLAISAQQTPFYLPVASQIGPMDVVARELETRKIDRSFDLLASITAQLGLAESEVAKSTATAGLADRIKPVQAEEASILDELKKLRDAPSPTDAAEKPAYDGLKQRQENLSKQAGDVRQRLQALSRKTASLGVPLTQPLSKAAEEMKVAGGNLGESDSHGALPHEENALSNLLEAQNGLSQAQEAMEEMAGRAGGGGGGPRVIARQGGGSRGAGNGRVRLPTAEDYRPPRAFREDLLESLKENYPKIYEDIIHRYYRRLAE